MSPDTEDQSAPDTRPLDREEKRVARLLRQLPGSMPSPETDRQIMAAAEHADAQTVRRRWPWGIGGAIAAGLALTMLWPESPPSPAPAPIEWSAAPATTEQASRSQTAAGPDEGLADTGPGGETHTPAAASARTETMLATRQRSATEPTPAERDADQASSQPRAPIAAKEPIPTPAETMSAVPARSNPDPNRGQDAAAEITESDREQSGPRSESAPLQWSEPLPAPEPEPKSFLPPVESDPGLPPESWLLRIQERLDAGQRDQAVRSLSLFLRRYPDHPLPDRLDELIR